MPRRLAGVAVLAAVALAGCSSGSGASVTVPSVAADEVLIQLGSYEIGGVPDEFVLGPEIVVYGDGTVYAELFVGVENGEAQYRLATGQLSESQLQGLFGAAAAMPEPGVVGEQGVDATPLMLRVGEQEWAINDLGVQPLRRFIDELRALADEEITQPWEPERWIVQPFEGECEVVATDPGAGPYDAPVYPHALAGHPLGAC